MSLNEGTYDCHLAWSNCKKFVQKMSSKYLKTKSENQELLSLFCPSGCESSVKIQMPLNCCEKTRQLKEDQIKKKMQNKRTKITKKSINRGSLLLFIPISRN